MIRLTALLMLRRLLRFLAVNDFSGASGGAGWSFAMNSNGARPPGVDAWAAITQDGDAADVRIYDQIGAWGVTAADVAEQISALDVSTLNVFVNSPGGDAYDGIAIMNALKRHKATVNVTVDGLAASAASVLCMGADRVVMARGSQFMVHDTWTYAAGNAAGLRAAAVQLDKLSDSYADCYAGKAGGDREEWRARMQAETWFTADEAVTAGLADEVQAVESVERVEARASAFDLAEFGYKGRSAVAIASAVEPENNNDEGVDVSELRSELVERLGLSADATDEDILAAVETPAASVVPEGVQMIDADVLAGLQADAAAGRAAAETQAADRRDAAVSAAVREGRIAPAAKATWLERMAADEAGTTALLGTLAAGSVASMTEVGHAGTVENGESDLYARVFNYEGGE